jgi:hypothetical protein
MECLVKFLDTALTRTMVVLDGMGYSPTNLPPKDKLNRSRPSARSCDGRAAELDSQHLEDEPKE